MREVTTYIFGTLDRTERFLAGQRKFNRATVLVACGLAAALYLQHKEIKALRMKVKELTEPVVEE